MSRVLHWLGVLVIALGAVLVLFAAYLTHEEDPTVGAEQQAPAGQWTAPEPASDEPAVRLHIPRLRKQWDVREGVSKHDLKRGPGHYPNTVGPGETGNFAVAGHRDTAVFWALDTLREGDPIVAETRVGWFVYKVTQIRVVRPTQVEVIAPDPHRPAAAPTQRLLTLTTCQPRLSNRRRLVVHASLSRASATRPPEVA